MRIGIRSLWRGDHRGWKMVHLEQYELAVTFSFLAMLVPPLNLIGLPAGIWSLAVLLRRDVKEAFDGGESELPKLKPLDPPTDWSPLVFGLVLIVPLIALMAFSMWFTTSAWVLSTLALIWFGLGVVSQTTEKKTEKKRQPG